MLNGGVCNIWFCVVVPMACICIVQRRVMPVMNGKVDGVRIFINNALDEIIPCIFTFFAQRYPLSHTHLPLTIEYSGKIRALRLSHLNYLEAISFTNN